MPAALTFDQAPPLGAPLRFFLTAPWFGVAAGLLLTSADSAALATRWSPLMLATTHLLVLGFMLQAMCGALLQFLPVGIGQAVWQPVRLATVVHLLLSSGSLALAAGFLAGSTPLLLAAAVLLGSGIGSFLLVAGAALWRASTAAVSGLLRLAFFALGITALLGIALVAGLTLPLPAALALPLPTLTDVHLAWGLAGWSLALLMAVATFVVPMFQLTPGFPRWPTRFGAPVLLGLLLLASGHLLDMPGFWPVFWTGHFPDPAVIGLALLAAALALTTLHLQTRGKRRQRDTTFQFFRAGMLCLLALAASAVAPLAVPALAGDPRFALWLGLLAIPGTLACVITGMMYKIVPFLCWRHLQRTGAAIATLPNMRGFISETAARRQLWLHLLSLLTLGAGIVAANDLLIRGGGLLFALASGWLGLNIALAARHYRQVKARVMAEMTASLTAVKATPAAPN